MASAFPAFSATFLPSSNPRTRAPPPNAWWSPIFGISSDPDYVDDANDRIQSDPAGPGKKQYRGCLTAEKAKDLRRKTVQTSNFHDVMYHSAIASRLASDVSDRRR